MGVAECGPTLGAALEGLAASRALRDVATVFPRSEASGSSITLAELDASSVRLARGLLAEGVSAGEVIGVVLPVGPELLTAVFGVTRAGAAVTVLPTGSGTPANLAHRLVQFVVASGMRVLIAGPDFGAVADELVRLCPGLRVLPPTADGSAALPTVRADDLAVVQYTSGSTTSPRGVALTHRNVLTGVTAIATSSEMTERDVWVQWTPAYHDTGLFGMLASLLNGGRTFAIQPATFVRRPETFLSLVAEVGGTLTTGPNFSYDLLAEVATPEFARQLDLSSWRLAYNGGEPVSHDTVRRFTEKLAVAGVRPSVMYPVYGMAEATLPVCFPVPGNAPQVVWVDRELLGTTGVVRQLPPENRRASALVSVGGPVAGMRMRLVGEDGTACPDGRSGEIQLQGDAVTSGYLRNPEASAELFDGAWLRTGDMGFTLAGELYIAGRRKEMVIVHGCNYFPHDAEHIARAVPGVYRRHAVAFADISPDSGESLGVIAESDLPADAHNTLIERIRNAIADELGIGGVTAHVVPPRFLTRSTSGKWQRLAAARRLEQRDGYDLRPAPR